MLEKKYINQLLAEKCNKNSKILFISDKDPYFAWLIESYQDPGKTISWERRGSVHGWMFTNEKWYSKFYLSIEELQKSYTKKYKIPLDFDNDEQVILAINVNIKHNFPITIRKYQKKINRFQSEINKFKLWYIDDRQAILDYLENAKS